MSRMLPGWITENGRRRACRSTGSERRGEQGDMGRNEPLECSLTSKTNGEEFVFSSMLQASDFLQYSKGYIQDRLRRQNTDIMRNKKTGEEYVFKVLGKGQRRDCNPKQQPKGLRKPMQPCAYCARAVGFCPWSKDSTPVEGWDAVPSSEGSYQINFCPLFWRDAETPAGRRKQRKILLEELENETGARIKAGPAASAPACKRCDLRAAARAMAEAAAGASA